MKRDEKMEREPGHARVTNLFLVEAGEPHSGTCRHRDGGEKAGNGRLHGINLSHRRIGLVVRNRSWTLTSSCHQDLDHGVISRIRLLAGFPPIFT